MTFSYPANSFKQYLGFCVLEYGPLWSMLQSQGFNSFFFFFVKILAALINKCTPTLESECDFFQVLISISAFGTIQNNSTNFPSYYPLSI